MVGGGHKYQNQSPSELFRGMAANAQQALKAKDDGNNFYKQLKFTDAVNCYRKAATLDPQNPVYLSNESAVLYQVGLYALCIEVASKAISILQGKADPSGLVPKLRARLARCFVAIGRVDEAIKMLKEDSTTLDNDNQIYLDGSFAHMQHEERIKAEDSPLAHECAVPSVRGSLQSPFYQYDLPISHERPGSLLLMSEEEPLAYPNALNCFDTGNRPFDELDLLFTHNNDLRHVLYTITGWAKTIPSTAKSKKDKQLAKLNIHLHEQNPRVLARHVLLLFVMAHPDLSESFRVHAANFIYYVWLSTALLPPFFSMLVSTLHELCQLSFNLETWRKNERSSWIEFGDEADLKAVRDCWIMWGAATEDEPKCRKDLAARVRLIQDRSADVLQRHYSTMFDCAESRASPLCRAEKAFFEKYQMILPAPELMEGDTNIPPKSLQKWLINPTLDVADPSVSVKDATIWIPEGRPDGFIFGDDPVHADYFRDWKTHTKETAADSKKKGEKPQATAFPGYSVLTVMYLSRLIHDLSYLKTLGAVSIRIWGGQFVDFNDIGSRVGQMITGEGIAFDRIHTGSLSQSIGALQTVVNAQLLLKPNLAHTALWILSEVHSTNRGDLQNYLYSKLRVENPKMIAPLGLFRRNIYTRNDVEHVFHIPGVHPDRDLETTNEACISQTLTGVGGWDLNMIKTWALDIFAYICMPPPARTKPPAFNFVVDANSSNLTTFIRVLELLLRRGVPATIIQLVVHSIFSGQISVSLLDDCINGSCQLDFKFNTIPYLMELSTLLTIARSKRLSRLVLTSPDIQRYPIIQDINACHWFQAQVVPIDNHPPASVHPFNPSINILIVDKTVQFEGSTTLIERLSMCKNREDYMSLVSKHAANIHVVSAVYWVPPATTKTASQCTFGFWLPPSFISKVSNRAHQSLLIFRTDIYMCAGVSSLATMQCTTD
jgi:tetratricopeptide (TPR) repeat protein